MALSLQSIIDAPIIELDTIDSTNNYAMQLIDADTAQPGMTVLAQQQNAGKGQRGRVWMDNYGESVLMSIITVPNHSLDEQFLFNATVIVSVADVLQHLDERWDVRIKWPNDIIVNDKKAGGILIENVLRGNKWAYGVIGLGLNVLQDDLDGSLLHAISLKRASGKTFMVREIAMMLRNEILRNLYLNITANDMMKRYNESLFRRGDKQKFYDERNEWSGVVLEAAPNGQLVVQLNDGSITEYTHGAVNWKWE